MKSNVEFYHGDKTCAVEPGKFCRWTGVRAFGTIRYCALFDQELFSEGGWLQRCESCLKEYPAGEPP